MNFSELLLSEPILRAVASEGYSVATPVQAEAIPHAVRGRDILGSAQTGTGKTAAFALPVLHRLSEAMAASGAVRPHGHKPRCLVLCPTRELATQIGQSFRAYGRHLHLRTAVVFGGVGIGPQADALRRGVDILVATPGRLLDLLGQGLANLGSIQMLVLDEADRMLDMGFIIDIRKIVALLPSNRQTLLFSATMPPEIRKFADAILRNPAKVQIGQVSRTVDSVDQAVYFVAREDKPALLSQLVSELPISRAVVFTRTKHGADRLVRRLRDAGISSEAIHGNKSQNARQRALDNFRNGKIPLLIATDVASRGIDVDGITHVVNYDLTDEPETYVHRIGRTARAGASGSAVSFCDKEEVPNLKAIEKLIRQAIPVKAVARLAPIPRPKHEAPGQASDSRTHSRQGESRHASARGGHLRHPSSQQPPRQPSPRQQPSRHHPLHENRLRSAQPGKPHRGFSNHRKGSHRQAAAAR